MVKKSLKGFTLIEILVVVALIAILTAITLIAINPAKNFRDTRNTQRSADVTQILNAITQYTSEQGHALADFGGANIPLCATPAQICGGDTSDPTPVPCAITTVDLSLLVDEYIAAIPIDPQPLGTISDTFYTICATTTGRVQIDAPQAEGGKVIQVKR